MSFAKQASNNLGISGKSINRGQKAQATQELGRGSKGQIHKKLDLTRRAGSILFNPALAAHEQHRTCWCHRGVAKAVDSVAVYRQVSGEGARLHGVTTCKSVWACPTCSARICAVRQAELSEAMKTWIGQGGYCEWPRPEGEDGAAPVKTSNYVWLMTLTFPHERGMPLAGLMEKFSKAKAYFKNCKTYKRILAKGVRKGSVTSLEVTLGEHGWHPHQHDLVFATNDAFGAVRELDQGRLASRLIDELKEAWYVALRKAGLCDQSQMSDVLAHGLDVRGGQYAAEYIAKFGREQKWGLSREVTMHAAKTGSDQKGAHPFQLLAWAEEGDGLAVEQFREYSEAFEGKRMLSWSRGLKKDLTGTDETSDEEAAERELPEEEVIGRIDSEALSVLHSRRLLAAFLDFVAAYCVQAETYQEDIDEYIKWAKEQPRYARGDVKVKMWSKGFMHVDRETEAA